MAAYDRVAFNMLLNAICSFVAGFALVLLTLKIFRVNTSRSKLVLLSLPFVKIIWDVVQGIPAESLLWTNIDPLSLPKDYTRALVLGTGFSGFGYFPLLEAFFTVKAPAGTIYSVSFAEFMRSWLVHKTAPSMPLILLGALFGVSAVLLIKRIVEWARFERVRLLDQRTGAQAVETRVVGRRKVEVYLTTLYTGTPFTGGVFRPYVCFPKNTYDALTPPEREAVIQHELAHVRYFDLIVTLFINFLGDVFWFVPGYRHLSRKIDRLREILADAMAVASGASALHLASALLRMKEQTMDIPKSVLYSTFIREKSILRERVERLTGEATAAAKPARFGWQNKWFRMAVTAWVTGSVCVATFAGNKKIEKLPPWAERLSNQMESWITSKITKISK